MAKTPLMLHLLKWDNVIISQNVVVAQVMTTIFGVGVPICYIIQIII